MTNEQAKSELMQLYGSLSEEKKKALDVAFKAMEQADGEYFCEDYSCIEIEKNCENCEYVSPSESNDNVCRNCDNKSNWKLKQAQADGEYISKSDMIDWLKDIRSRIKPQGFHTASEFEIAENQILNLIQMLQMGAFPTVAIPPEHDGCKDCRWQSQSETEMPCKQCKHNYTDEWERAKIGHWIWQTEDIYQCSECGEDIHVKEVMNEPQYAWCPICGCPMDIER